MKHTRLLLLLVLVFMALPQLTARAQDATGLIAAWDVATGEQTLTITPALPVEFATFNADNTRVVAQTEDGTIHVYDASTGEPLFTIPTDPELADLGLAVSTNQLLFVVTDTVHVWDLNTGEEQFTLPHDDAALGGDWSADETRILTWGSDGAIRVWDALTGEELMVYAPLDESFRTPVNHAQWNTNEKRILASGADGSVRVWDARTGEELLTLWHLVFWIGAQWSLDESRIMTRAQDDMLWQWDVETGEELHRIDPLGTETEEGASAETTIPPYSHARWSPGGGHFLTWGMGDDPGAVMIWNLNDLENPQTLIHRFPMMYTAVDDAQWNRYGGRILSRTIGAPGVGAAWVWDPANPDAPLLEARVCCGELLGTSWNADETQVLAWGRVWDMCGCE